MENVIVENIITAIKENRLNDKVMPNDHVVTKEEREKVIINYDNSKRKLKNKFNNFIANIIINNLTKKINKNTVVIGIENLFNINSGAIITCNHFNPIDSTIVRYALNKTNKKNKLDIIVAETNVFMKGFLGWLLRSGNTYPICENHEYITKNLFPAIEKSLKKGRFILIYPEQEMWINYKKPRPLKNGAYHFACKFNVPIIPCFVELHEDKNKNIKHIINIGKPIYPISSLSLLENKNQMREKDYNFKVKAYEKAFNKKLTYNYEEGDIVGV